MFGKILVPLDGSAFGERALPMAVALAKATKGTLTLVRAAQPPATRTAGAVTTESKAVGDAEVYLTGIAKQLATQGIQADTAAPCATPAEGILTEIGIHKADLVVMCTHGRSGLGRWIYGSVAAAVLARSPVPVLLVRPTGPLARLDLAQQDATILVPLDGSSFAEAALSHAAHLATAIGGKLVLLRVVVPPLGYYPDPMLGQPYVRDVGERLLENDEKEARQYLAGLATRIGGGPTVQQAVRVGFPSEAILDEAKAVGASLIAMSTHGRTGLGELLLGSVALDVVRRGGLPLLLVRPSGLGEPVRTAGGSEQW